MPRPTTRSTTPRVTRQRMVNGMSAPHQRLTDVLRFRIERGELEADTKLPSEKALAAHYMVSRPTLRLALDALQAEGLVEKQHGRGNFVRRTDARMTYVGGKHITPEPDDGLVEAVEVGVASKVTAANYELAEFLDVPEGALVREYLFLGFEGDWPRTSARVYVPDSVALLPAKLNGRSPWGHAVRNALAQAGVHVASTVERLITRPPTAQEAEDLRITGTTPVIELQRTSYDARGNVVEGAILVLRGDRTEAVYTTRAGAPMRLLPWESESGNPAFVSTDPGGHVSQVADHVEAVQMKDAESVMRIAQAVLDDEKADKTDLRFALREATKALRGITRIAHSRGLRLPNPPLGLASDGGSDEPSSPQSLMPVPANYLRP
ncbi:hypothetical protein CTZ27_12575 [Streptomyces griseocarneus]|nr:hypothetical protein CTZ27_12575 [Streptomyces griseocarneus]